MSTPKGTKCIPRALATGDRVLLYSNADHIVLQLRHQVPTEEQLLEPSFKVAVSLSSAEAVAIASDLLNTALLQLAVLRATFEAAKETGLEKDAACSSSDGIGLLS